jgi:hypothetical protein
MVDEAVVVNNLVYAGDDATIDSASKGSVGRLTVRSGTLSPSTLPTGVTVGSLVLDGGTLSVSSDFIGTIAVAEGGGTLFLEGEWNDAASVSLPAGLSFAEGADLSKVTVQATIGESTSPAMFAIAHENETCSLEYVGYPYNLEDLDLSWMTCGWSTPHKNKAVGGAPLQLFNGDSWIEYPRGIGTHGASSWYVRLNGNAASFSATVGVDKESDGQSGGEVNFIVRDVVGGTNLVESGTMTCSTPAKNITVNLDGIELIELCVDMLGNNAWDHADWVNPTIVMKGESAPATRSADGTNRWTGMGENDYWVTAGNWEFGVPAADATAVFDESVTVRIGQTGENSTTPEKITVSNVVVNSGATLTLRPVSPEFWDGPELIVQEINGAGKIRLAKVGIKANYVGERTECLINVAEIEMLPVTRWNNEIDSWLHGESNEGKFMVVNSTVKGTGRFYTHGNVTLNGDIKMSREFKMESKNASAKTVILDGGWVSAENLGEIEKLAFHSGTYDYADYADKGWPLYLDGGTVNIGDGSSIGSDGLELGVLSGGYVALTISDADFAAGGTPAYPSGLTFGNDADLSKVVAVVKNASGDAQKTYAITKTGDVYSFAELAATDTVKWIGGIDDRWETAGNWIYGSVPTEGQSVVFERSAHVYIKKGTTTPRIATMTIGRGAVVKIETTEEWGWDNEPVILFEEITGEGTLALKHASLRAARSTGRSVVNCAELQILSHANNDAGRSSKIWGNKENLKSEVEINADITGSGTLILRYGVRLAGDNSRFTGLVRFVAFSDSYSMGGEKYFCVPEAAFTSASKCELQGRFHVLFNEGTLKFGNVAITESYGTGLYVPYGASGIVFEIAEGEIRDNWQGLGIGVYTRSEGSDYVEGATAGCAGVTIKKVGEGSLVYGMTKEHSLVVEGGHVEFTGENDNGDDASVDVTVKQGASVGSAAKFSHENPTWTNGGDVTVRHKFTFEPGAAIKQEYVVTPVTEEQLEPVYENETFISNIVHVVETGDYVYSMRKLTIADDVDLSNVVFGVTNPDDLPAVTKASLADLPRFTMFAANSLSGAVATENGGYAPEGSVKNGAWIARPSRTAANAVEFRPYVMCGFMVIIK